MGDYGCERWLQGMEETIAAQMGWATVAAIGTSTPLNPILGGMLPNLAAVSGVSLDARNSEEPWAQWLAHVVYDSGYVAVYRLDAVVAYAIGGTTVLPDEGGCGAIDEGASATTNYGNPISASTCGNPAWQVCLLPDQFDASSGTADPCGCVAGGPQKYDLPVLYVATIRPGVPRGVPWTALPEAVVGYAGLQPPNDDYGIAAALVASGLPPYMVPPTETMAASGLMPMRLRPWGAL